MTKKRLDIRNIKKKYEEVGRNKLLKYEQKYFYDYHYDHLDRIAQLHPKAKAFQNKKKVKCLTCDDIITHKEANGCHWISR
jgi:hypothetical protein